MYLGYVFIKCVLRLHVNVPIVFIFVISQVSTPSTGDQNKVIILAQTAPSAGTTLGSL